MPALPNRLNYHSLIEMLELPLVGLGTVVVVERQHHKQQNQQK